MATGSIIKPRQRRSSWLPLISLLLIVAAVVLFVNELMQFSQREDQLPAGVRVAGVPVGNLSELTAATRIEEIYTSPVTLYYDGAPINLSPNTLGFEANVPVMLAAARATGDSGGGFWARFLNYLLGREETRGQVIPLEASYQQNALRAQLEEIARVYDRPAGTASYDLDTLTIAEGTVGYRMDIDEAMERVDAALRSPDNRAVELPIIGGEAASTSLSVLEEMILAYLDSQGFIYDGQNSVASVFILDLTTGEEINIQGDVAFTAASTNKVGIMLEMFRANEQELDQDQAYLLANAMLCSENSSANRIMSTYFSNQVGERAIFDGLARVTETFQFVGANNTFLTAPLVTGEANQVFGSNPAPETNPNPNPNLSTQPDLYNQTTAEDMGTIFSLIYDCATYGSGLRTVYPDGEFTQRECQQMLELMSANDLQRLLQAGIPPGTRIAHKNGWLPGLLAGAVGPTTGDAGIVFSPNGRHYVISVYIWERTDTTGFEHWPLVEEISRATWNYFNPENPLTERRSDLPAEGVLCAVKNEQGVYSTYNYLPPYGSVDLDNINGWRDGTPSTPQPPAGQ